jgi:hypothetical protein
MQIPVAPEVIALKSIVHTQNNMKTELECVVAALPLATVHWFHNGYPMLPDNRITKIDTDLVSMDNLVTLKQLSNVFKFYRQIKPKSTTTRSTSTPFESETLKTKTWANTNVEPKIKSASKVFSLK